MDEILRDWHEETLARVAKELDQLEESLIGTLLAERAHQRIAQQLNWLKSASPGQSTDIARAQGEIRVWERLLEPGLGLKGQVMSELARRAREKEKPKT